MLYQLDQAIEKELPWVYTEYYLLPTYLPTYLPACLLTYLPTYLSECSLTLENRCDSRNLWPLWHLIRVMRWPDLTKRTYLPTTFLPTCLPAYLPTHLPTNLRKHPQGAILDTCDNWDIWSAVMIWVFSNGAIIGTCDICDTDYNTDNWDYWQSLLPDN